MGARAIWRGVIVLVLGVGWCTDAVAPAVVSMRQLHAAEDHGWNATAGSGLRVTEGWGYMDQNVLHVHPAAAADGGDRTTLTYSALFFPCEAANPTSPWLLYCVRVWRSSDGAQSPVLRLGGPSSPLEAYQPPMLFHHNGTLLVANWAQGSSGSLVLLSSLSAERWDSRDSGASWALQDSFAVDRGSSFNYLGGAMDPNGGTYLWPMTGKRSNTRGLFEP